MRTQRYDDNFGEWSDMDDPDTQAFARHVERTSVEKKCSICGNMVHIMPHYDKCNSCCEKIEQGLEF